jgi:hypothetical protein
MRCMLSTVLHVLAGPSARERCATAAAAILSCTRPTGLSSMSARAWRRLCEVRGALTSSSKPFSFQLFPLRRPYNFCASAFFPVGRASLSPRHAASWWGGGPRKLSPMLVLTSIPIRRRERGRAADAGQHSGAHSTSGRRESFRAFL